MTVKSLTHRTLAPPHKLTTAQTAHMLPTASPSAARAGIAGRNAPRITTALCIACGLLAVAACVGAVPSVSAATPEMETSDAVPPHPLAAAPVAQPHSAHPSEDLPQQHDQGAVFTADSAAAEKEARNVSPQTLASAPAAAVAEQQGGIPGDLPPQSAEAAEAADREHRAMVVAAVGAYLAGDHAALEGFSPKELARYRQEIEALAQENEATLQDDQDWMASRSVSIMLCLLLILVRYLAVQMCLTFHNHTCCMLSRLKGRT